MPNPRPKHRFWRLCRIYFRRFRISIWLVTIIVLSALLYLNRVGLPDFIKRPLVSKLREHGVALEFARLRWHWGEGIVAHHVSFGSMDEPAAPQLLAEQVQIKLNASALLARPVAGGFPRARGRSPRMDSAQFQHAHPRPLGREHPGPVAVVAGRSMAAGRSARALCRRGHPRVRQHHQCHRHPGLGFSQRQRRPALHALAGTIAEAGRHAGIHFLFVAARVAARAGGRCPQPAKLRRAPQPERRAGRYPVGAGGGGGVCLASFPGGQQRTLARGNQPQGGQRPNALGQHHQPGPATPPCLARAATGRRGRRPHPARVRRRDPVGHRRPDPAQGTLGSRRHESHPAVRVRGTRHGSGDHPLGARRRGSVQCHAGGCHKCRRAGRFAGVVDQSPRLSTRLVGGRAGVAGVSARPRGRPRRRSLGRSPADRHESPGQVVSRRARCRGATGHRHARARLHGRLQISI